MQWFRENAPIRLKLLITFAIMTGLTALAALAPLLASADVALAISGSATLMTIIAGFLIRKAIADPYVATVVRMEGLAAGDLVTPIKFTEHRDCVGRMTVAMFTFQEAISAQILANEKAKVSAAAVQAMAANIHSLAEGDLTAEITADCPAELSNLKVSFNNALENLRNLIVGVAESAHVLHNGSHEIAQASEDLARRTESNAASLEETSAALIQIETRLQATASSSKGTVTRADQAIASVGTGRMTAEGAMQAMTRVSFSAKGIDSVIEGVDKIAFQTRVLAMNAAVEAGRAGDAGRGFAVVADLVSALAMRAEEEAKRARDQLTVTQAEIVIAVDAVQKVDGALSDISGDVDAVHKLLASMAADNLAQSAAVTQISSAVGSMDKATQQNAAMVEETSAAARNLTTEVETLAKQTGQFRTGPLDSHPATRSAAPAQQVKLAQKVTKPALRAVSKAAVRSGSNGYANVHAVAGNDWADF